MDVKEVAFKAFKVAYDRETGYVGYKVSGEEFKLECTKFDKLLLVFKDGTYKVTELPEKLFVGPELFYCGLPERERVFTCAYTNREASYLKRFTFGGTILNKVYLCIPDKSRILFFAPDTPKLLYVRYKPAPHQKINQQTCDPAEVEVKAPEDAWAADFHQGHLLRHRRTDARLGRKGDHDENRVCVNFRTAASRSAGAIPSGTALVIQVDLHQSQFLPQFPAGVSPELHPVRVAGEDEDIAFLDAGLAEFRQAGIHELSSDTTAPMTF